MTARFATALVTGSGKGIGRALAEQLLAEGATVVAIDRNEAGWYGAWSGRGRITPIVCDLADRAAILPLVKRLKAHGPFDLVIHNAGVNATGRFEDIAPEAYRTLLTVNAETPIVMSGAMLREKLYAKNARLVFVSSLSHAAGYPGASVYAAAKDALAVYAASIRKPLSRAGITVTTVFPGPTRTEHAQRHAPEGASVLRRMKPERLAAHILIAAEKGRPTLYPGITAKATRIAAAIAPERVTQAMRKLIYEKLKGPVW